mmetsp:Transcript_53073/g.95805  ORF Transcript_53073/g.95805 Transcript_53073/m.95805 type:complete len:163 (+) Transcript_53073:3-491(+)
MVNQLRKKEGYIKRLESVFKSIDDLGNGMISEERLLDILADPDVQTYFETLDLDVHEGAALFHLLDNGDGQVTLEEFISGIMRCKGPARAIDQLAMHAELKQLDAKVSKLWRHARPDTYDSSSDGSNSMGVNTHLRAFKDTVEGAFLLRKGTVSYVPDDAAF